MKGIPLILALMALMGVILACRPAAKPAAEEPYKIGVTAAITGPAGSFYAPWYEGLRNYISRLNDAGGIDGHPIQIVAEDNGGAPPKAAAQAKKLIDVDKVLLLIDLSVSATYPPIIDEAKKANIPFIPAVCPSPQGLPPSDPGIYCIVSVPEAQGPFAARYIKEAAKGAPVKVSFLAWDIPGARKLMEVAANKAKEVGLEVTGTAAIPGGTTDFTPFASRIINEGAEWVYAVGPEAVLTGTYDALTRLGWKGNFFVDYGGSYDDILRGRPNYIAMTFVAAFGESLPEHQVLRETMQKYGVSYPVERTLWGWLYGIVVEKALRTCGWPCDRAKLGKVMNDIEFDFKGLTPKKLKWTPENRHGLSIYRVYRWDPDKDRVIPISDWEEVDVTKELKK